MIHSSPPEPSLLLPCPLLSLAAFYPHTCPLSSPMAAILPDRKGERGSCFCPSTVKVNSFLTSLAPQPPLVPAWGHYPALGPLATLGKARKPGWSLPPLPGEGMARAWRKGEGCLWIGPEPQK